MADLDDDFEDAKGLTAENVGTGGKDAACSVVPEPTRSNGSTSLCIIPDCGGERRWKGLCQACYGQAKRLIENGQTTWEELVKMGLALEPLTAAFHRLKRKP